MAVSLRSTRSDNASLPVPNGSISPVGCPGPRRARRHQPALTRSARRAYTSGRSLPPGSPPSEPDFAVNCKLAAGSLDDLEPGDVLVLERGTEARFVGIRARAELLPGLSLLLPTHGRSASRRWGRSSVTELTRVGKHLAGA